MVIKDKMQVLRQDMLKTRSLLPKKADHNKGKLPKEKKKKNDNRYFLFRRFLILVVMIFAATLVLALNLISARVSLVAGEIAAEDIYFNGTTTTYASDIRTEESRALAAAQVGQVYVIDDAVEQNLLIYVDDCFASILDAAYNKKYASNFNISSLEEILPGTYSESTLNELLSLDEQDIVYLKELLSGILSDYYQQGIGRDDLPKIKESMAAAIAGSPITGNSELFLKSFLDGLDLSHNKEYDAVSTAAAVDEAMEAVGIVQVTVQSGEKLVSRGAIVTEGQVEALQALGLHSENSAVIPYLGLLLVVAILFVLLFLYLKMFQPTIYKKISLIWLLGFIILLVLLVSKLISLISINNTNDFAQLIGYILPVGAAAMLVFVLLGRDTAIVSTIVLSVFVGIIMNGQYASMIIALVSGMTGVLCAIKLNQRSQFVGSSLYIALANAVVIIGWGLIQSQSISFIGVGLIFGLLNGLLSAILAMGILPFLESGFGVTTVIRLLELSNSNHPLLKRLMMEAPGTYNHSILVGNLAEAAAGAIGADTLLVRVASYYHDIGKLRRPYFFIENQHPGENPHDKLQPALSSMIITSHAVEGGQMLRESKFPEEIIDIVEQHHGTGVLSCFYYKALEMAEDKDKVRMDDYRYKGLRPQTREAGVVLLADSVQAAVQSLTNPSKSDIEQLVANVIKGKIGDGQLQECPLTFKDLDTISQSFLMVLGGMYHSRIAYPTLKQTEKSEEKTQEKEMDISADISVDKPGEGATNTDGDAKTIASGGKEDNITD